MFIKVKNLLIILILFLIVNTSFSQSEWETLSFTPDYLVSPFFLDYETGWAVSYYKNEAYKTEDGGNTWSRIMIQESGRDVFFIDDNVGWISGGKIISKSEDGGWNWRQVYRADYYIDIKKIYFRNENEGLSFGSSAAMLRTVDGGETWNEDYNDDVVDAYPNKLFFLNEKTGWFAGFKEGKAFLMRTNDWGETWEDTLFADFEEITDVNFSDSLNGKILTLSGHVGITNDGGKTWTFTKNTDAEYGNYFLEMFDLETGLQMSVGVFEGISTFYPKLSFTRNNGENWESWGDIGTENILELGYLNVNSGLLLGGKNIIRFDINTTEDTVVFSNLLKNTISGDIKDLVFLNDNNGLALTWNSLHRTLDGGKTWENIGDYGNNLKSLYFKDENNGWIISNYIKRTRDGGATWESVSLGLGQYWRGMDFVNDNIGWLVGRNLIYKTENGGENWKREHYFDGDFNIVHFVNDDLGFIVEEDSIIWKTEDGGVNWESTTMPDLYGSKKIVFVNTEIGFLAGKKLFITIDGGLHWKALSSPEYLVDMVLVDNKLLAITQQGLLYESVDYGETWKSERQFGRELSCIFVSNNSSAWIGGESGLVLKTSSIVSVEDELNMAAQRDFSLYQNYPNPFNPETKIKFALPEAGKVKLKIYDILGREITVLVDEYRQAGVYEIKFSANGLSSGVYFYRIVSGNYKETRKMILLQ